MSELEKQSIESLLKEIKPSRRLFLKRSLMAGSIAMLAAPSSTVLAQQPEDPPDTGGQGKGRGKGQGKGTGKGRGKGKGKGQGKGKGSGPE